MLNCTDIDCILHHHAYLHVNPLQHHLQDDRQHHEHHHVVMSGENNDDISKEIAGILNGTNATELSSLSHVDAPSESVYMVCGVLIAMLLVAVIIVLLAVTISKLRKREDVNSAPAVVTTNHNNNTVIQPPPDVVVTTPPPPLPPQETVQPPPFLWQYSSSNGSTTASSQYTLYNNDQDNLVQTVACEEPSECKGFRKNLRGKWRRLVKKKPQQEVYTIPAELRDQLKQIYVY